MSTDSDYRKKEFLYNNLEMDIDKRIQSFKEFKENRKLFGKFEEEYFLKKLLKWEMREYRKLKNVGVEDINLYCFNIIRDCVNYNKTFLAEMVFYMRNKINTEISFGSNIALISYDSKF